MYIQPNTHNFLLLIQPAEYSRRNETKPIKAIVRRVSLKPFGNFMMGTARIYRHSIVVSGAYGGDGLPCNVPNEVYNRAKIVLPENLVDEWNNGGGWNSAGSEAPAMRKWALENLAELKK